MIESESRESLTPFGFTELEAAAYVYLLGESPATGYRVAQGIGKPVANTYKALESLQAKGAVVAEDGDGRLCRAVPAGELLGLLARRFEDQHRRAGRALARLKASPDDQRIYQLRTPAQVKERCRRMLTDCRRIAIVDAFPAALEEMRPAIEKATARGIRVAIKVYRPAVVAGADVVAHPDGEATLRRWPGQWLNLVCDAREYLLAFFTDDGSSVHQAVWSGSAYLSVVYHSAVASEVTLGLVERLTREGASGATIRQALDRYRYLFKPEIPGFRELFQRFGGASSSVPPKRAKRKTGAS